MPCYSQTAVRLTSKMQRLDKVAEAAKSLGFDVISQSSTHVTVRDRETWASITYRVEGEFISGQSYDDQDDVQKMTLGIQRKYAENRIRQFAEQKGYTVVRGQKAGQFDLVQRQTVAVGAGASKYRR